MDHIAESSVKLNLEDSFPHFLLTNLVDVGRGATI